VQVLEIAGVARALGGAFPAARLPCPVCAASVKGENVASHLAKVHPGAQPAGAPWAGKGALGVFPCTLELDDRGFALRHWLGLARRVVPVPCAIAVGALVGHRADPIMASYADEMNVGTEPVRAGRYLRLGGARSITIGCRRNTQFAAHWRADGWTRGAPTGSTDLVVGVDAMVAIEYALVSLGLLAPAPPPS
jgi:hypothetical protein